MFDSFPGRSAICLHYFGSVAAEFVTSAGVFEEIRDPVEEFVNDLFSRKFRQSDQSLIVLECADCVGEVVGVIAGKYGASGGGGFEDALAAMRDQRSADEDHFCERVNRAKFADAVEQDHIGIAVSVILHA